MSPLGTTGTFKARQANLPQKRAQALQAKQGRRRWRGSAHRRREWTLPAMGRQSVPGDLQVRGPWVIKSYFKGEGGDPLEDGWFPTGDVCTIDPEGYIQMRDARRT